MPDRGRRELKALRAEAIQEAGLRPDPVDLALAMSGDLDEDILCGYLDDRVRMLSAHPVLRTPSEQVTRFDDALAQLIADLIDTVREPGRAGLAACQIGSGLAAFSWAPQG